jgi:glucose-1-phosphate thymidylyltransferase
MKYETVGLVPAAGSATRMGSLPCSKEIFPVGFAEIARDKSPKPKAVCQHLLEAYNRAGISNVFVVVRNGKWDIPAFLGDGASVELNLCYLVVGENGGPAFTVDGAFPFIKSSRVVFGFPDILFSPDDTFITLLEHQDSTGADVVLGLFKAEGRSNESVETVSNGQVVAIRRTSRELNRGLTWISAVWTPTFSQFLHQYLRMEFIHPSNSVCNGGVPQSEFSVGEAIAAAIDHGLSVQGVVFRDGQFLDIGTPAGLYEAYRREFTRGTWSPR